jgi:hypothetical protein
VKGIGEVVSLIVGCRIKFVGFAKPEELNTVFYFPLLLDIHVKQRKVKSDKVIFCKN